MDPLHTFTVLGIRGLQPACYVIWSAVCRPSSLSMVHIFRLGRPGSAGQLMFSNPPNSVLNPQADLSHEQW